FFLYVSACHRVLHSFPTRRSSDLYASIEPKLKELLTDFGPPRKTIYTSFPFIRLANDHLWQFDKPEIINSKQDYTNKYLFEHDRSEEHTSELQSRENLVCRLLLEK